MEVSIVNGETLYHAFLSGALEINKKKNMLNKINVFPIADGDTGSNLVSTMNSIVEETKIHTSFKETLKSIADAALIGARGNSGIIFAQYINGIYEEIRDVHVINRITFSETLKKAVPYAYKAIMNPIEGTMLTVIRDWAEAVYQLKDEARNFEEIIIKSIAAAKKSLTNTSNLLSILKKNEVVDSGASGFVYFLEGAAEYLQNKRPIQITKTKYENEEEHIHLHDNNEEIKFRFCTEALISNNEADFDDLKFELSSMGDSLIVAGNSNKIRIHIHTNDPDKVFLFLRNRGTIIQQKVDDMKKQYEVVNNRISTTAILTDSIADLPQELVDKYQIHVIPLNLLIEGSPYLDKVTIKPDKFYSLLDKLSEYPTTSQPTIKSVENMYSFLTGHYESIITILVSSKMSGTYQIISRAAEKFINSGMKIKVIDSRLNSGAEGLLVLEAAKLLEKGKSFEQVTDAIQNKIKQTKIYVSVDTLKYMVRGGRVSEIKGLLAKIVNLKPIVSIDNDGNGIAFGKSFSTKRSIAKILKIVQSSNRNKKITKYCIIHANAIGKAEKLSMELTKITGRLPEYISEISPIVGLNAGIGSVAVAYFEGDDTEGSEIV